MRLRGFRFRVVFFALALTSTLRARSLQVLPADGTSTTLTAVQITSLPHVTVNVKDHDTPAQFEGVPLAAALNLAGVRLGTSMRGPRMTEALLAKATDGYEVVFALVEPGIQNVSRTPRETLGPGRFAP